MTTKKPTPQETMEKVRAFLHHYKEANEGSLVRVDKNQIEIYELCEEMYKDCCVMREALKSGLEQIDDPHEHSLEYIEDTNRKALSQVSDYPSSK